jgi:hypothetical protein
VRSSPRPSAQEAGSHVAWALLGAALVVAACGESLRSSSKRDGDTSGNGGGGAKGGSSRGGSSGTAGEGGVGADGKGGASEPGCTPTPLVERRLVRLSANQIIASIEAWLGSELAETIRVNEAIAPLAQRSFMPLHDEGTVFGPRMLEQIDRIGGAVGRAVRDAFTACGDTPTDACAEEFVTSFAESAFRRPLAGVERDNLLTVYAECKTAGATVAEAVEHGVWAAIHSPIFLYRTELGTSDDTDAEVPLAPYELASELSFFLTDGPPDADLLDAARRDELAPDELAAHAERLLTEQPARANLEAALHAYFQSGYVPALVLDPAVVPGLRVDTGLLDSIANEGQLFYRNILWDGPLTDLLTSRRAWVNGRIAMPIYGVAPPSTDPDVFGPVELPPDRAGLLTSSPFLASVTGGQSTTVVRRGLAINRKVLCQRNPPFPESDPSIASDIAAQASWSERQRAEYRTEHALCDACHEQFDAYGMTLEGFDAIGRARTMDLSGNALDSMATLPALFDGRTVTDAAEMALVIAESGLFERCMAMNVTNFALADESQGSVTAFPEAPASSCAVDDIVQAIEAAGDPSFSRLVVEIVRSRTFRLRKGAP